ncbi:MAG: n-acetylglutamate synthase [Flavobacteriales bacterium]|nr:n-acetylglutamate synthase [Flavobacteriales bacterium]
MNYHDRRFRPVSNSENGQVSSEMVFHYQQHGSILTCAYSGGAIRSGHLIGLVDEQGNIDMRYHQVDALGELRTGTCRSRPERTVDGKLRLMEEWQWTSGDGSAGSSVLEEV